jgi:hypothetical protein
MITRWRWTFLVIALVGFCPVLASAEDGLPSQETIKAMGLSGMVTMSDTEALAVRGEGVHVWGDSFSRIGTMMTSAETNDDAHYDVTGKYYGAGGSHAKSSKLVINGTVAGVGLPFTGLDVDLTVHYTGVSSSGGSWGRAF